MFDRLFPQTEKNVEREKQFLGYYFRKFNDHLNLDIKFKSFFVAKNN